MEGLRARAIQRPSRYLEFLRAPAMSAGVYVLDAGATDRQSPHTEDEIYYVVRGRGRFRQGDQDAAVRTGDTLFVPAGEEHRFHAIEEELLLLVVFAPAERTRSSDPDSSPGIPEFSA
jgi:mannose-6-phosphate isomerase-like protein (cupin superfamily)